MNLSQSSRIRKLNIGYHDLEDGSLGEVILLGGEGLHLDRSVVLQVDVHQSEGLYQGLHRPACK